MDSTHTDTPVKPAITEADVRDFLIEKAREMQLRFGGYGSVNMSAHYSTAGTTSHDVSVGAGNMAYHYSAPDFATALKIAEAKETPAGRLAEKEARLADMQAEIEALKAKQPKEDAA